MVKEPTTLAELQTIAEKTNIPLGELQREYRIYEYSFTSCAEAVAGYINKGGYKSNVLDSESDERTPDVIAYHKAWEAISLQEQPDVTKLSLSEAIAFMDVCFRYGDQLVALVLTIEKHIGTDLGKIAEFVHLPKRFTCYSHNECPINLLQKRLMTIVETHYKTEMDKTWDQATLIALHDEAIGYDFQNVRPYPELFDLLGAKIIRTARTIPELHELQYWQGKVKRWIELLPQTKIDDILPSLMKFLKDLLNGNGYNCSNSRDYVLHIIDQLFYRCNDEPKGLDYAKTLLDIGRKFFYPAEDQEDVVYYSHYVPTSEIVLKKRLEKARTPREFSEIISDATNKSLVARNAEEKWKKWTRRALKKPIPNFAHLYSWAEKSLKGEVLAKWNEWGIQQLDGVDTWEDLILFIDTENLIPIPQQRFGGSYYISVTDRNDFSAFINFIKKLMIAASTLEKNIQLMQFLYKKSEYLRECHSFGLFTKEFEEIFKRILLENPSVETLQSMYDRAVRFTHRNYTTLYELVADEMIVRNPVAIVEIFQWISTHMSKDSALYSKYLRKNVALQTS